MLSKESLLKRYPSAVVSETQKEVPRTQAKQVILVLVLSALAAVVALALGNVLGMSRGNSALLVLPMGLLVAMVYYMFFAKPLEILEVCDQDNVWYRLRSAADIRSFAERQTAGTIVGFSMIATIDTSGSNVTNWVGLAWLAGGLLFGALFFYRCHQAKAEDDVATEVGSSNRLALILASLAFINGLVCSLLSVAEELGSTVSGLSTLIGLTIIAFWLYDYKKD